MFAGVLTEQQSHAPSPVEDLQKLMDDAEMLADVKAYGAAKARLEDGEDELIPLEITERRRRGKTALRIWCEYRQLNQEQNPKLLRSDKRDVTVIRMQRY